MAYKTFDRSKLNIKPISERIHDLHIPQMLVPLDAPVPPFSDPAIPKIAEAMIKAHEKSAPVILMMGAHLLRKGMAPMIIDLMEKGLINHIGLNGAGCIHDYELARIGATTESVARYIHEGQFGLWQETGELNDIINHGSDAGLGIGEAVGKAIVENDYPYRKTSLLARAWELGVPVTVHVSIGSDIIHEHPNCDGAKLGKASYQDFLVFTNTIDHLEQGVYLSYGTAIMGPEVYLKALAMARNVAFQEGRQISHFTTAVFDLQDLGTDWHQEIPKDQATYYFRPYKTILVRTVADGGVSYYVRGDHAVTFPNLYHSIIDHFQDGRG
ncbi:MAG TPA: hypothetical protein PKX37_03510 [Flexilinea sp.]|nr:hypothetical protein [Flexilinea sp.]